jgi:hypothetical protein
MNKIKYLGQDSQLGGFLQVRNTENGKEGPARWAGFAKEEKLAYWKNKSSAVLLSVKADSIEEQKLQLKLKGTISAIGLKKEVLVNGRVIGRAGDVKILTREPMSDWERRVSDRLPIVKTNNGDIQVFTSNDLLAGPGELLLFGD